MDEDMRKLQLELGGRNFELIEFTLSRMVRGKMVRGLYGVNVAKVREVVRMPKINSLASRVKGVTGIFELRGIPIPAVHLAVALGDADAEPGPTSQIIVTEFSQKRAGFIVDTTNRIRRISWDKVLPPSADTASCINGMTLIDDNEFLFILDLERLLVTLEYESQAPLNGPRGMPPTVYGQGQMPVGQPLASAPTADSPVRTGQSGRGRRVLLVDDSQFIRAGVKQALEREGFGVTEAGDGAEAMKLMDSVAAGTRPAFDLVITDVEMPRMDGMSFTRELRAKPQFATLPIILHTSLSGKANQAAGLSLGANGYVVKNDLNTLFAMIKEILGTGGHALSA